MNNFVGAAIVGVGVLLEVVAVNHPPEFIKQQLVQDALAREASANASAKLAAKLAAEAPMKRKSSPAVCIPVLAQLAHARTMLDMEKSDIMIYHYSVPYANSAASLFDRSIALAEHFGCTNGSNG